MTSKKNQFDTNINKIEQIISILETEDIPIEEAINKFEQAFALIKENEKTLTEAKQKIEIITSEQKNNN